MKILTFLCAALTAMAVSGSALAADSTTSTTSALKQLAEAKATGCVYIEGPLFLEFTPNERYFDARSEIVIEMAAAKELGFEVVSGERFNTPEGPFYGTMLCISQTAP